MEEMSLRKKLIVSVLSVVAVAAAIVAQVSGGHAAFAAGPVSGGYCGPYQNLQYYRNNGCVYSSAPTMWQGSGAFLNVSYYLDSSVTPYSVLVSAAANAAQNWSYTSHAKLTRVYSPCGGSNCIIASANTTSGDCHGFGNSIPSPKTLTLYITPSATCSLNAWTGLTAHEIGHTMGLDHNTYGFNGDPTTCAGATYSMLMVGGCYIKVSQPQPSDFSALNALYPGDPNNCTWAASNLNCNNEDYIQEGCNAYPQSAQTVSNSVITVKLYYSTNCTSNWVWAKLSNPNAWVITQETIERAGGTSDGPDFKLTEFPNAGSWYTNMLFAPIASAEGCVYYTDGYHPGSLCTGWS
jgi:hypothetical protein